MDISRNVTFSRRVTTEQLTQYTHAFISSFGMHSQSSKVFDSLTGRVLRGVTDDDFRALIDNPARRVVFFLDSSALSDLIGLDGFSILSRLGYDRQYIMRLLEVGTKFKLLVIPTQAVKPATWENLLDLVKEAYPDWADRVDEARHPLMTDSYEEVMMGSSVAREVRQFLEEVLNVNRLFAGDGFTRAESISSAPVFGEYIGQNRPLDDFDEYALIGFEVPSDDRLSTSPIAPQQAGTGTDEGYTLIYGLSANPIHQGHADLVVDATLALVERGYLIKRVMIIPVFRRNPVGKPKDDLPGSFEHRFAMCKLAAREISDRLGSLHVSADVSRIEEQIARDRQEPNYTLETLTLLKDQESRIRVIFLLSSDLFAGETPEFGRWYKPDELVRLATLAICPRPGYERNEQFLHEYEARGAAFIYLDELTPRDVSATYIKERLDSGEDPMQLSAEGLLPRSVAAYIKQHDLYRSQSGNTRAQRLSWLRRLFRH